MVVAALKCVAELHVLGHLVKRIELLADCTGTRLHTHNHLMLLLLLLLLVLRLVVWRWVSSGRWHAPVLLQVHADSVEDG